VWTPCPRNIDKPVLILGFELEDLTVIAASLVLAGLFLDALPAFGVAGLFAGALWVLKRGQPPGVVIHTFHRLGVLPIKGVLRSRTQRYSPWS